MSLCTKLIAGAALCAVAWNAASAQHTFSLAAKPDILASALPNPEKPRLPLPALNSIRGLEKHIARLKAQARASEAVREAQEEEDERRAARIKQKGNTKPESRNQKQTSRQQAAKKIPAAVQHALEEEQESAGVDYWEAYLFQMRQRAYPEDSVNWNAYDNAVQHREQMPEAQIGNPRTPQTIGGAWEFVGPRNLAVPYRIYYGLGPLAGRINAAAYDPLDPNVYYVGTAGGGLWKTTDRGVTWQPLSDNWPSLQVSSIAIHPTNNKIIYVGTGDFDGYGGYGFGLMKTIDGGATWTNVGSAAFGRFAVSAIALDPENPNILTVSSGRPPDWWSKLWRSTDGGATWSVVINVDASWSDLAYGARNTTTGVRRLYATGHYNGGQIWRSDNRGATWTRLSPPISNVNWYDHDSLEIATSPTSPDTVYLLVGHDKKILKSVNAGAAWTDITPGFPAGASDYNWSQASYDATIRCSTRTVSGAPRDVLYVDLIDQVMSRDAGTTWQSLGGPTYDTNALLHNDQHCIAINPRNANESLVGCDGGIYRLTYNPTNNSWTYVSLNANLGISQIYKMAAHPTDTTRLLAGTQDNATPAALGSLTTWQNVGGGDGGFCAILNSNVQYATSQVLGLYKTTDNWVNTEYIGPDTGSDRVAFIAPIVLSPTGNFLYAGTNYLWRRNESTGIWTERLGGTQLASGTIMFIAVAPSDANRIYTGSDSGELWMTTNGGTTWTQINTGTVSLPARAITSISVQPTNPSSILVGVSGTGSGHLWRCTNTAAGAARTWADVSGAGATGLPDIPLNAVALDPDAPATTWYVGTDVGVFMTTGSGATWTNATAPLGLPNVQVNDVKMVSATRSLYAATYGRGMWRIGIPSVVRTVSGTVTLPDCVNRVQPITFTFRPVGNGTAFSRTVPLTANGSFSLTAIPSGNYTLAIKGGKWLRKAVACNVSSGNVTGIHVTLPGGDANNDNWVDALDLSDLITAFNSEAGDLGFNPTADFNCDNFVDALDLAILITYFNQEGDL